MTDLVFKSPISPDRAGLFAVLQALERGSEPSVEMQLLQWVMGLPAGLDPAIAARSVLAYQQDHPNCTLSQRLLRLLEIVGEFPAERLTALSRRRGDRVRN